MSQPVVTRAEAVRLLLAALALPVSRARARDVPPAPTGDATDFLKWSMDRHAALKTYRARGTWGVFGSEAATETQNPATREVWYAAPNRFRVHHADPAWLSRFWVCDGKEVMEFVRGKKRPASVYPAMRHESPTTIFGAGEKAMSHPFSGGSPLYGFFGGSAYLETFLNANLNKLTHPGREPLPTTFGPDVVIGGEPCKTVVFCGGLFYDERRAAIRTRDGMAVRVAGINYARPLTDAERKQRQDSLEQFKKSAYWKERTPEQREEEERYAAQTTTPYGRTEEVYTEILPDAAIDDRYFDVSLVNPELVRVGSVAPEFTVTRLADGKPLRLADLRGKAVLIDFWATWCVPCVKGLPGTLALHREFADKGLVVLAVTDEKADVVRPWLLKSGFTGLPVYLRTGEEMADAYNVAAIPTLVVIDRAGRVAARMVAPEKEEVARALARAGVG
jgi:thiol-disulfide isomerase/thioredoxin